MTWKDTVRSTASSSRGSAISSAACTSMRGSAAAYLACACATTVSSRSTPTTRAAPASASIASP